METINFTIDKYNGVTNVADFIKELASSDSRLHKEAVIERALVAANLGSAQAELFLFACYKAYNPFHVYGVKKVPTTEGLTNKPNPWPKFWDMLELLRLRDLTGNNAKTAIEFMSEQFDSDEWNLVCRPVIVKDLRCGTSEKTINKIVGNTDWVIPTFTCQLASGCDGHPNKMTGVKRLEQKLDGVRVLAVMTKNAVTMFSRNGKPFENFKHIEDALENLRPKLNPLIRKYKNGIVFDGEVIGASFQALMKQAQRKTDVQADDLVYNIFDYVPLEDFYRGYWNTQQHKRIELLEAFGPIAEDNTTCVRVMNGITVDLDTSEGHDILRRYANDAVEAGFEGIMIKDLDAPYECKRSTFWLKWKPVITVDLNIVGFEEGTGRNEGRLGAIICEGVDDGRTISVNVGSGFSDTDRDGYWSARDELFGRVIEVAADAVSQNQDGTYSLRFPRFVRFRGFEPGEKL